MIYILVEPKPIIYVLQEYTHERGIHYPLTSKIFSNIYLLFKIYILCIFNTVSIYIYHIGSLVIQIMDHRPFLCNGNTSIIAPLLYT